MREGGFPAYFFKMYSSVTTYGGGSVRVGDIAESGTRLADLRPALLWPLPSICAEASRRARFGGRADDGVVPLVVGGIEGWRTAEGARLADMDGDGEERDVITAPFVCMPGGMGRFALVATDTAEAAATVGAIWMGELLPAGSGVREGDPSLRGCSPARIASGGLAREKKIC